MITRSLLPGAPKIVLAQQVRRLISRRKGIRIERLRLDTDLSAELGFDTLDVVDIILELERQYHFPIPDELPLHTVGDFVHYMRRHRASTPTAGAAWFVRTSGQQPLAKG